ncbi:MAG: MFS transporter [Acidobacteriota bacterium]|nr:MFS transporter [Acidobacteriota bacterium]
MDEQNLNESSFSGTALAASLALFVLLGAATTMLGPLLPTLEAQFHLTDRQAGLLFVAQFGAGFLGAAASGALIRLTSIRSSVRLGYVLIALGVALVPHPSAWSLTAAIALYGLGIGFVTPSVSVGICQVCAADQARALNLLNFAWAVGAIAAPGAIFRLVQAGLLGLSSTMLAASILLAAAVLLVPSYGEAAPEPAPSGEFAARDLRLILCAGVVIFAYVGLENGVAGWLPSLAGRLGAISAGRAALLQAAFWAALLVGRLLAGLWLRPGHEHHLLLADMLLAVAATVAILAGRGEAVLFAAVALCGLAFATIFPTTIAVLSAGLSPASRRRLGWMYAAGGLGGAVLPYCIGALSARTHSLLRGMSLLLAGEAVMLLAFIALRGAARSARVSDSVEETVAAR